MSQIIFIFCCLLASLLDDSGIHVEAFQYSPLLGGFAAVLSNGRAAFITANTLKFEPDVSQQKIILQLCGIFFIQSLR